MKPFCVRNKHEASIIAKLINEEVNSLSKSDIRKALENTVMPTKNIQVAEDMVSRGLTIDNLYHVEYCNGMINNISGTASAFNRL